MAQRAVGTKLKIGTTFVAELSSISGLDLSADTIDVTSLDSNGGYRDFIGGFKDGGEVSITGFFNPGDVGQSAIYTAFEAGTRDQYAIIFPAALGAEWDFAGVVTKFTTGAQLEDAVSFDATIKVAGKPSLGVTPSAGLSGLTVTGTGGALAPAFANGNYSYSYAGVTAATATITVTATGTQTIKMYVNGVYTQDLTSGAASNSIPLSSATGTDVVIIAYEQGKVAKVYEVIIVKT